MPHIEKLMSDRALRPRKPPKTYFHGKKFLDTNFERVPAIAVPAIRIPAIAEKKLFWVKWKKPTKPLK